MRKLRFFTSLCLVLATCGTPIMAATTITDISQGSVVSLAETGTSIPSEVANAQSYLELTVKDKDGTIINSISHYVEKIITQGNPNELCDVRGYTDIKPRAFAYLTGEGVKIGVELEYQSLNGGVIKQWIDKIALYPATTLNYPDCTDLTVSVSGPVTFTLPNQNNTEFRVDIPFITSAGGSRTVTTSHGIPLGEYVPSKPITKTLDTVLDISVADFTKKVLGNHKVEIAKLTGDPIPQETKLLASPVTLTNGGNLYLSALSKTLDTLKYQLIKSDTTPKLPETTDANWVDVEVVKTIEPNTIEAYPDIILDPGKISTAHFNYKYGSQTDNATTGVPTREDTFNYPLGDSMVIQNATVSANGYSNTNQTGAFIPKDNTGKTINGIANVNTATIYFTPSEDGSYQFAIYGPEGAYIDIEVDGKTIVCANNLGTTTKNSPSYKTNDTKVFLNKGVAYKLTYKMRNTSETQVQSSLWYKNTTSSSNANWKLMNYDEITNDTYFGSTNKAVKFWGYLIPDVTGEYVLGSYSDDGAYGYLIFGEEKVEFVNNWTKQEATTRSSNIAMGLVAGKAYPIYMEWYEGCPSHAAFIPQYKKAGTNTWSNIPSNWFYASANTTPADDTLAYFESTSSADYGLRLPTKNGTYYLAVQTEDKLSAKEPAIVSQVLYGPIVIDIAPNIVSGGAANNYVIPNGLSSLSYKFTADRELMATEIILDVEALTQATTLAPNNAKKFLNLDLSKAIITIKENGSTQTLKLGQASSQYTTVLSGTKIKVYKAQNLNANATCDITVTIPTTLAKEVAYGPANAQASYLYMVSQGKKVDFGFKVSGKPVIYDELGKLIDTDMQLIVSTAQDLKLLEIPTIH